MSLALIKPKANSTADVIYSTRNFLYFAIVVLLFLRLFINDLSHQIGMG